MPSFDGWPFDAQVQEVRFEAAVYELLRSEPNIMLSNLLYHRVPVQLEGPRLEPPQDIVGRLFFVFEKAEGKTNIWNKNQLGTQGMQPILARPKGPMLILSLGLPS